MVGLLVALVLVVRTHVGVPAQDINLNNKNENKKVRYQSFLMRDLANPMK